MMVREPPSLRVRPRLEIWDRAAQQPVVVVGLVQRDEVFDGVDEIAEQRELLRRRRRALGAATAVSKGARVELRLLVLDERVRFGARAAAVPVELRIWVLRRVSAVNLSPAITE